MTKSTTFHLDDDAEEIAKDIIAFYNTKDSSKYYRFNEIIFIALETESLKKIKENVDISKIEIISKFKLTTNKKSHFIQLKKEQINFIKEFKENYKDNGYNVQYNQIFKTALVLLYEDVKHLIEQL